MGIESAFALVLLRLCACMQVRMLNTGTQSSCAEDPMATILCLPADVCVISMHACLQLPGKSVLLDVRSFLKAVCTRS